MTESFNVLLCYRVNLIGLTSNSVFAGFTDETPRDYHCNLGPDGRRRDADERPELCRGAVEFVATKEFMVSLSGIYMEMIYLLIFAFIDCLPLEGYSVIDDVG